MSNGGILDLWERDAQISLRPQPGEGTDLPTFYELHHADIRLFAIAMLVLVTLGGVWALRRHLRIAVILLLARALQAKRAASTALRALWSEVEKRANG